MIAVCGIGMPSGCLNNAVTANQSASAPTMPASAAARTYPTQAAARPPFCAQVHARKITVAAIRKPSATNFIRRSARRRSASASGSASAKDSANEPRVSDMPEMPAVPDADREIGVPGRRSRRIRSSCHDSIIRYPVDIAGSTGQSSYCDRGRGTTRPSVRGWS